jgi:tetratricopeptide (TPR) repeat protein
VQEAATLVSCARFELDTRRRTHLETRLSSARAAAAALPLPDAERWTDVVLRLEAARQLDTGEWDRMQEMPSAAFDAVPWLLDLVTGVAAARAGWARQDDNAFGRAAMAARRLEGRGRASGDQEVLRAWMLVQASIAGGQYERDEMHLLLEEADRLEQTLAAAFGDVFVPVLLARELEADLWLQTDRYLRAAAIYREVLQRHPFRVHSWRGLAAACRRLDLADEARAAEAEAERLAPQSPAP